MEIMNIEPDIIDKEDAPELVEPQGEIQFENVSFSYKNGEERVLSNINLTIEKGKTVAIVGPSDLELASLHYVI